MLDFERALRGLGVAPALMLLVLGCGNGSGAKSPPKTGSGPTGLPNVPGEPDTSVQTALPPVARLPNVTATAIGDSVSISVEPVEGAKDYRVYVLPDDADVMPGADGAVTVKNAIYRCAGDRQSPRVSVDAEMARQSESFRTFVDGQEVEGYKRSLDEATLGHVYVTPGEGRIPVYALGDPAVKADNLCYWQRWNQSRVKRYVTSEEERKKLIAEHWRDDGIAFYVPSGSKGTKPVHRATGDVALYYVDGPEADKRGGGEDAFSVLKEPALPDTVPLMRVYYQNACGNSHDELAAGVPRFERARYQGDAHPQFDMTWSGITGDTTLVVEALDQGCPFQGFLAPASKPAGNEDGIDYPAFNTLDDLQAASPTGEVFVNGQHEAENKPRPIARSFVKIAPGPKPQMDWFAGFGPDEDVPDFMSLGFEDPCDDPTSPQCTGQKRQVSDYADVSFFGVTPNRITMGTMLGQLWVTYADVGADVAGKVRFTPTTRAKMSAESYLHVTMEVDAFTTARRYPQIIVSDATVPVQGNLATANSVIVQVFPDGGTPNWPMLIYAQVCDHRNWEVNDQCPAKDLWRLPKPGSTGDFDLIRLGSGPEVAELTGVDRTTHIDAFLSTARAYIFVNAIPFGCVNLPPKGVPSGDVSVTFGDVLYHSGVDEVFAFHKAHQQVVAKRHFDNLGFKSGVEGPAWDEALMPCYEN
ncbi:MAG TPA: hypothetical protein VHB79_03350 [Polyangiaceae bacterium]|nr:hypothetical protein [Polyangiaceae bacterium]